MKNKSFYFVLNSTVKLILLILLAGSVFAKTPKNSRNTRLCNAASQFLSVYQQNCPQSTEDRSPSTEVQNYCDDVEYRFLSADDISESEQQQNMRSFASNSEESDICFEKEERMEAIVKILNKVITYFATLKNLKYNQAVIGARTVQAQIALAMETLRNSETEMSPTLLNELLALEKRCKEVAILLEDQNSWKWSMADQMASASFYWKTPISWKSWDILGSKKIETVSYLRNLTHYEKSHWKSNECQARLMRDCDLSQECANVFMNKFGEITTLAHNTEFFRVAVRLECVKELEFITKFPNGNWEQFAENNCERMWDEANAISGADFPLGYKLIFLLHGRMCGMMGYGNFIRSDWMTSVMKWMDSTTNGCIAPDTKSGTGEIPLGYDDLAEKGEWCAIYETSMGMQLLAMHMRYAMEKCPKMESIGQSS